MDIQILQTFFILPCFIIVHCNVISAQLTLPDTNVSSTTDNPAPTTPVRLSGCLNGGICRVYNQTGYCEVCTCPTVFFGALCQHILTRVDGVATYTRSGNDTRLGVNETAVRLLVQRAVSERAANATVSARASGSTTVRVSLTIYFLRPTAWHNYSNLIPTENRVRSVLADPTSLQAIFGSSLNVELALLQLDVRECVSLWHNCHAHAICINLKPGYRCLCDSGYEGDGVTCTRIKCALGSAPQTPVFATRKVFSANLTEIADPPQTLDFGTTIEFFCPKYYILADFKTASTNPVVVECGGSPTYKRSKWSGNDVSCNLGSSVKIAIVMSVISVLIILLVLGCFAVDCCVKRDRKSEARSRLREEEDTDNFPTDAFDT